MIAHFLQDDLKTELEAIFEHFYLKDPNGRTSKIHVYEQSLPIPEADDIPDTVTDLELEEGTYNAQAKEMPFPYILVRVQEGIIEKIDGDQAVDVNLLIGVYNHDRRNQGHKDVMNIIQKIYERFAKNAILANRYECVMPMEWALQEEESYPYFFGGMALRFETASIRREDPYA